MLPSEDPQEFANRVNDLLDKYVPTTIAQAELVRHAVIRSWKLDRAGRHEAVLLTRPMHQAIVSRRDASNELIAEAAAMASFDPSIEAGRLRRYQSAMQRELVRTLEAPARLKTLESDASNIRANEADSTTLADPTSPANEANSAGAYVDGPGFLGMGIEPSSAGSNQTIYANEANSAPGVQVLSASDRNVQQNRPVSSGRTKPIGHTGRVGDRLFGAARRRERSQIGR